MNFSEQLFVSFVLLRKLRHQKLFCVIAAYNLFDVQFCSLAHFSNFTLKFEKSQQETEISIREQLRIAITSERQLFFSHFLANLPQNFAAEQKIFTHRNKFIRWECESRKNYFFKGFDLFYRAEKWTIPVVSTKVRYMSNKGDFQYAFDWGSHGREISKFETAEQCDTKWIRI